MVQHGVPRHFAEILGSFDAGIAAGELAVVSDSVQRFTGRKPESLADCCANVPPGPGSEILSDAASLEAE
jgi:hypothetical protein